MPDSGFQNFVERALWWAVGIGSTLFTTGVTGLIAMLWHMNGSIVTLNDRVGTVLERLARDEAQSEVAMHGLADRVTSLENTRKEKPRR